MKGTLLGNAVIDDGILKTSSTVTNAPTSYFRTNPIPIALSSYSLLAWVKLDHTNADNISGGVMTIGRNDNTDEFTGIAFHTNRFYYDSTGIRR